jgi:hypothetical protein
MATNKLLKRIVAPNIAMDKSSDIASELHNYTHGINSDPLALFAILFSALIHDVDHKGAHMVLFVCMAVQFNGMDVC